MTTDAPSQDLNTIADYITTMATTIQVSPKLLNELKKRKMHEKESYEELLWALLEDTMELSEETKRNIARSEREIKAGKTISLAQIKKEFGLQ